MDISIIQAILVFVVAFIMGIDQFSFLESLYQPIVTCPIIGAILGNFELGIVVGGAYQLMQIGSMPIGGAQPPNAIMGGIMATVFAVSLNMEATAEGVGAALGLAVPFAVFGQYAVTLTFTFMSGMMAKADKCAENADVKGIRNINLTTMLIISVTYGVLAFLCAYVAQEPMQAFVNWLPEVITHGLEVAGGILPAVGFGMLLRVMMKAKYIPYLIAGFLMACFIEMPNLLPVALLGAIFALIDFFGSKQRKQEIAEALNNANLNGNGGDSDVGI